MLKVLNQKEFDSAYAILKESFPIAEFRTKEKQKALLQKKEYVLYGIYKEESDEEIVGILATWQIRGYIYIEHFAIKNSLRGSGIGGRLLQQLQESSETKIVLEVELPEETMQKRRVAFYEKHGFHGNDFSYMQPPLREGEALFPLMLMTYPRSLSETEFLQCKKLLYDTVYEYNS
ncbi:MAG: GNAT family N-acetyltransferase [Bacillota bacterium]